jgi:ATP-binding cassette subfamily B protein
VQAARSLSLVGQGVRIGPAQLPHVHVPAIAHQAGNHYVVLFRLDRDGALVGDPATGLVRMSVAHFAETFSGQMLLLRPAPQPAPR